MRAISNLFAGTNGYYQSVAGNEWKRAIWMAGGLLESTLRKQREG
jgi:catechol-2,3-dioxygenase